MSASLLVMDFFDGSFLAFGYFFVVFDWLFVVFVVFY